MSKGTPIIPIRVPPALLTEIDAIIHRTADSRQGEPWTRTSWIIQAIKDKLNHMARARRPRHRKPQHNRESA